ncbi:Acetyl-CoA carboxytransferase [Heracleum sosnowskyi]|uniref:acetyl-CoA carboxytransferase n=1 Tax=Heracleum sosnowskyi TaxID=360622 RepID=A0AAD8HTP8_9APIA|nr:Acetyl-CoA carboxytransferase [Heracleum sosnowskyi]
MASVLHSPVTGNLASKTLGSDLLQSSSNGASGVPLRALGRARWGMSKREFVIVAKVRKVKKHDYPWPDNADENVKGGVLSHLSPFKPLKEKPKPVTLDFEKPLMDLQKKIIDVQKMANETGLDFTEQIISLENKYQQALKDLYTHLTPIQRVNIARHPNRPTCLDHIFNITEKFVELHGDRAGYDDPAIVTGLGSINGRSYMFIGQQKGRNTKENIMRNFGMPTPHGYRKALRMMYYADHHGFPIVTFIDTPGAYADLKSEELGQGEAIAHNLRTMFGLKVPIVSIVMGEGGSGGALAIGCCNKMLMLENAVFYVASPEACAAILWKTAKASPKAAEKLKITATELTKLQISDGIIPEPLGGAHADPYWTSQQIKAAIVESMDELLKMDTEELLKHRMLKYRKLGGFQEGIPQDPIKKAHMKKKTEPSIPRPGNLELEGEVEKLKEQILKAKESSAAPPELGMNEMIDKLKNEIDYEYSEAAKSLGLSDKFVKLQEEFAKARNSKDQSIQPALLDKMQKLKDEFNQKLHTAPNYNSLKIKLDMLKEVSRAKSMSEKNKEASPLQLEIQKKYKDILNQPDIKQKLEALKAEIENTGASGVEDLDQGLKEKIGQVKKDIESEFADALEPLGLRVNKVPVPVKAKVNELNKDSIKIIEDVISSSSELKHKIELLKIEVAIAGKTPSTESKNKIQALEQEIKQGVEKAISSSSLKEKFERLKAEIAEAVESSEGNDGSLVSGSTPEINYEANRSYS